MDDAPRLSFFIRASNDTLPTPRNLPTLGLPDPSLQHILSGCKTAMTQGRYRWGSEQHHEGSVPPVIRRRVEHESWLRELKFPQEITTTSLHPDVVLWSTSTRTVIMAELTVPWEEGMEAAFQRNKEMYPELAAVCSEAGWKAFIYPVEVGCKSYTGTSTQWFLKSLGITGSRLTKALKDLTGEAPCSQINVTDGGASVSPVCVEEQRWLPTSFVLYCVAGWEACFISIRLLL